MTKNALHTNEAKLVRTAILQMCSSEDIDDNLSFVDESARNAKAQSASWLVLPEYFACITDDSSRHAELCEAQRHIHSSLSEIAARNNLWIFAGSMPVTPTESERIRNESDQKSNKPVGRCIVYKRDGSIAGHYDKIHLFDADVADNKKNYRESNSTAPGSTQVSVIDAEHALVGVGICYDLRFPELFRAYSRLGAKILVIPAAFTHNTGRSHWQHLLRARAIENQCYVIACAQGGQHACGRRTWGHSMVLDPWGEILSELDDEPKLLIQDIDLSRVDEVRKKMPVLSHRRL